MKFGLVYVTCLRRKFVEEKWVRKCQEAIVRSQTKGEY